MSGRVYDVKLADQMSAAPGRWQYPAEDMLYAARRLKDRISYFGWFLAISSGAALWWGISYFFF